MKQIFIWICMLWLLFSCGKSNVNLNSFNGTYVGYFHRDSKDTVQVSLLFQENQYSGYREKKFCPQLGRGTFEQNEHNILFAGTSNRTYQDKTAGPMLNGAYSYEINADGSVRMWKKNGSNWEEFILRKSSDESLVYGIITKK
ncbi:hypothetical protein OCK74_14580 [Chitinophagaceae bacterium LB-8]|uniref:Lipoprotein n=1 Tax=Paraflavisolibacter caeni TaxID=2982496 RepID=A0A9X2XWU2_9BACT|nr:hypothetical protein [Paraflavisolibacter caeni]MCU7550345.1 hypothetical protein [Paraflavisolibacter caeni]